MNKFFYPRLAADNLKKNTKIYFPYVASCIITVAMFYIIVSMTMNKGLDEVIEAQTTKSLMGMGAAVVAIFAAVFLIYANNFLAKRRRREFGLFNILGMEKKHIALMVFFENLYVWAISLGFGLLLGITLDKLMNLILFKLIGSAVSLGFYISSGAALCAAALISAIFIIVFLGTVRRLKTWNAVELLKSGSVGEKEPKTKIFMAVLGAVCLLSGYAMALFIENPMLVLSLFFVAVILVIAGTYLLFSSGSIAVLKALRKNKRFYYRRNHFISVSGMIYRMKQNAVGLGNICILSTMVLVMLSSTVSLWAGLDAAAEKTNPNDISVNVSSSDLSIAGDIDRTVNNACTANGLKLTGKCKYRYFATVCVFDENGNLKFETPENISSVSSAVSVQIIPIGDYNALAGTQETLGDGEIMVYAYNTSVDTPELAIGSKAFTVKKHFESPELLKGAVINVTPTAICLVRDIDTVLDIFDEYYAIGGFRNAAVKTYYGYDILGDEQAKGEAAQFAADHLSEHTWSDEYIVESRISTYESSKSLYGSFLFIGLFLSILFITASVLIIYYKQISEGYEDQARYEILQKVGMDRSEVRSAVRSQILSVFFLPLAVAGIHMAVASPILLRLLSLMALSYKSLFIGCVIACYAAFAALYFAVYLITARSYYKIVER